MVQDNDVKGAQRSPGIGLRVTIAVNLVLVVGIAGFLVYDYVREVRQRTRDMVGTLDDEALTLHQAIVAVGANRADLVQSLVDGVCIRMSDETSPGHHFVVQIGDTIHQSTAHRRDSDEFAIMIRRAADTSKRQIQHRNRDLIVGAFREQGIDVYVVEEFEKVKEQIRRQFWIRTLGVLIVGGMITMALNLAIQRLVVRPVRRLVRAIESVRVGKLGFQAAPFGSLELDRVATAFNTLSLDLAAEFDRRRAIIAKARAVQESLFPANQMTVPGATMVAVHRAAEDVAGDFYDVIPLEDGRVLICIADVIGHGVPAAMLAAILKVLILDAAHNQSNPAGIVTSVNRRFTSVTLAEDFASLFVAIWDANRGRLEYANAGHEPPILIQSRNTAEFLRATGSLIGLCESQEWENVVLPIGADATLLCSTDGVSEAMNGTGDRFGRDRILAIARHSGVSAPSLLLQRIDDEIAEHRGNCQLTDDFTLMGVRLEPQKGRIRS